MDVSVYIQLMLFFCEFIKNLRKILLTKITETRVRRCYTEVNIK